MLSPATQSAGASFPVFWLERGPNGAEEEKRYHRRSQTPRFCEAIGSPGGAPVHYRLINTCLEEQHTCEWKIDTKSLRSKNTCLTRTYRPQFGDFVFYIRAKQSSDKRGGRSIGAAGGRGYIDAKLISTVRGLSTRLLSVSVGGVKRRVAHDFDTDGQSCRVKGMWSLEEAAENSREGAAVLIFRFGVAAARTVQEDD